VLGGRAVARGGRRKRLGLASCDCIGYICRRPFRDWDRLPSHSHAPRQPVPFSLRNRLLVLSSRTLGYSRTGPRPDRNPGLPLCASDKSSEPAAAPNGVAGSVFHFVVSTARALSTVRALTQKHAFVTFA
jgi:hypothetical protein